MRSWRPRVSRRTRRRSKAPHWQSLEIFRACSEGCLQNRRHQGADMIYSSLSPSIPLSVIILYLRSSSSHFLSVEESTTRTVRYPFLTFVRPLAFVISVYACRTSVHHRRTVACSRPPLGNLEVNLLTSRTPKPILKLLLSIYQCKLRRCRSSSCQRHHAT